MADAPFYLQWHITSRCNLRCAHCYQSDYADQISESLFQEGLEKFGRHLSRAGAKGQINLTGGEPMLHPDFFSFAQKIRDAGHRLAILTNGTLIDAAAASRLAALQPVFVQISLDGTREAHERIRGAGSFDAAVAGIDALASAGVKVLVSFTAQKSNAHCFEALVRFCGEHGVHKFWWDRVVTDDPALYLTTAQFRALTETANRLRRAFVDAGARMKVDNGRALQSTFSDAPCYYACSAGRGLLIFLPDGSVMPCRRLPFVIGNYRDGELEEIIRESELMTRLRGAGIPKECVYCPKASGCRGGAKCVTYAQTGQLFARDVNCFYEG